MANRSRTTASLIAVTLPLCLISATAFPQNFADRIEARVQRAVDEKAVHGAVLVIRAGEIVYRGAYGLADMEWNIPNTPGTKFRIASLSKSFVAALTLQENESGTLALDDSIVKHLSWYRADTGARVTIHHLLSHTSGIPNYLESADYFIQGSLKPYRPKPFIESYCSGDLKFEPGSEFDYSPSNYIVLGAILETVSGTKLADLLQERILDPLGMNETGFDDALSIIPHRANGYDVYRDGLRNARYLDMSTAGASGGLYSTVDDLAKWHNALSGDTVLSPSSRAHMFRENLGGYAYGWFVADRQVAGRTIRVHSHGGRINGFNAAVVRVPEEDYLVVILNNVTQYSCYTLAFELLDLLVITTP